MFPLCNPNRAKAKVLLILYLLNDTEVLSDQTDIDECSTDPSACDKNADCINTDGSYSCKCKRGFDGDGKACRGIRIQ